MTSTTDYCCRRKRGPIQKRLVAVCGWLAVSAIALVGSAREAVWGQQHVPVRNDHSQHTLPDDEKSPAEARRTETLPFSSPLQFVADRFTDTVLTATSPLLRTPVRMPNRAGVSRSRRPLRMIELVGGDRIPAEIEQWNDSRVTLRLPTRARCELPRDLIAKVSLPAGEAEFPHADLEAALKSGRLEIKGAESGCRLQFWMNVTSDSTCQFRFSSQGEDRAPLVFQLEGLRLRIADLSALGLRGFAQSVTLKPGWHCFTAVLDRTRTLVAVDRNFVAGNSHRGFSLAQFDFSDRRHTELADLLASRLSDEPVPQTTPTTVVDDSVMTHVGDETFGTLISLDPDGVRFRFGQSAKAVRERIFPWSSVSAVVMAQSDKPITDGARLAGNAVVPEGVVARIELQGFADRPAFSGALLTATVTELDSTLLVAHHRWLGRLAIPWSEVARLEPVCVGRSLTLDARKRHLGDSIRADFSRPMPEGTDWQGEFTLATTELANGWVTLNVSDLEPSGPETPLGSPFLKELRAGHLLTELLLNDVPVAELNRQLSRRASILAPERIRVPVPRKHLRAGTNTWRIRQHPLKPKGTDFDDCELSDVRLEISVP